MSYYEENDWARFTDSVKRADQAFNALADPIEDAQKLFVRRGIKWQLKNIANGHFHVWTLHTNELCQFWATTGRIMIKGKMVDYKGIDKLMRYVVSH